MKMDEFYTYVLSFYGKHGLYPMGATLVDVKAATKIHKHRTNIEFEGDSVDRETVRDILIEDFGYKFPRVGEADPKPKLNIDALTGWVGLDRYREAIADIEANMRGEVPEELKGMSMAQIYERLNAGKAKIKGEYDV
jgi:hypothetical protein